MPRFFTGDELGSVKSVRYTQGNTPKEWKPDIVTWQEGDGRAKAVQKLAVSNEDSGVQGKLAAARADGSATVFNEGDDSGPSVVHEWQEPRLKSGQRYVGLALSERRVYSCTSNGALRLTQLGNEGTATSTQTSVLPMRICDWRLSQTGDTFAYGGNEVELSVWNTAQAFASREVSTAGDSKKRKRSDQLLPGEIWRAKNLSNDSLSLRQPVHITALTYLQPSSLASHQQLLAGMQEGNVRRYDTRVAKRPVADWKGIGKISGINSIEKGLAEHEVFIADRGCNIFALDLRNGKVAYGYKGLSGAVTSLASSSGLLASVSQDRFFRLHSTFPPPTEVGSQQEQKGEVLDRVFTKTIPSDVIWDGILGDERTDNAAESDGEDAGDDMWEAMEDVDDNDTDARRGKKRRVTE
ncbi:hypothetical protein WOLCODRAFT_149194 [Wolfiporia cocos MD-104 SS10]|uniref:Ribosome biogenesis protein NSA1 n=1 Tax=Wolfiporia cocos (strain MD-104) TaxID=742152 RepID=A0A2H3J7N7_WOLCO|nr:hypothetical protein WOLCODRAFT_149194 [Wolfiporia cocos MD-104 SS10]